MIAGEVNILHDYFDGPTKLFSVLFLAKFLDAPAKSKNYFCVNKNITSSMTKKKLQFPKLLT